MIGERPLLSKEPVTERETGCWSNNTAAGYANALNRCKAHLESAVNFLNQDQVVRAEGSMKDARRCMDEANVWFNQSNNEHFRVAALVQEVKALRSGVGVTYAEGDDPTSDDWRLKR